MPTLFIAGTIITFLSQNTIMRCLGPKANPVIAYAVASVSGCILAVDGEVKVAGVSSKIPSPDEIKEMIR
ncbi:MAG: hypothetical protein NUV86_00900 [Candidatus Scalindua sp.]|nr:hypothetical protein [Candidatus Scalindua sp.]MCR4343326.1 hypothetical protein [Candidatus Scalindua sp.]